MPQLDIVELDRHDLAMAWPLVRTAYPELRQDDWQQFAEALIERGGGVLAVAPRDCQLHGIATYEMIAKPRFGRVLNVDMLVTFEMVRRAPARAALMHALKQLSAAGDCSGTIICVPKRPPSRRHRSRTDLEN